jgi:ribosome biogenesis SPOUT family RNA methylase Rps3
MIDESTIQDAPEVSAVRFMESMKKKMELLLRTGDVAQEPSKPVGSRKIVTDPEEEQRRIEFALKQREEGLSWAKIAEDTPWSAGTLTDLLRRRGLHKPLRTIEERKAKREEVYALTRRVHELRPEKSAEEAVKIVGGITADQYQRARGELNLPALKRYKRTNTHN